MIIRHLSRFSRYLLFWSLMLCALLLSGLRIAMLYAADYKTALEQKISEVAELPIRIGTLTPKMRGFAPELVLKNLSIAAVDHSEKPAVQLKEMRIGIDLLQWLLHRGDALAASWVTLVGVNISVVRHLDGSFAIKGLNSNSDTQPLWLLQGGQYEILQSEISWQDLRRHGEPVMFNQFDLLLKNKEGGQRHEVHLFSRLPKTYGDSLRISAELSGNPFAANDLSGRVYLEGKNIHWGQLIRGDLPGQVQIKSADTDIKLWSDWRESQLVWLTTELAARNVALISGQKPPIAFDALGGSLSVSRQPNHWRLDAHELQIRDDGKTAQPSTLSLAVYDDERVAAAISHLDLQAIQPFRAWLLPNYSDLKWQGHLKNTVLFVDSKQQQFAIDGQFSDLATTASQDVPQLQGLSGVVQGNQQQGRLSLHADDAAWHIPKLFRGAFAISQFDSTLTWQQTPRHWQVQAADVRLNTADFQTTSRFTLQIPHDKQPPLLDLRCDIRDFNDISHVKHYLPVSVMGKDTVEWLDDALVAGRIPQGFLTFSGALGGTAQSQFEAVLNLEQGELQFNEHWPHLNGLQATVQFLGDGLTVGIDQARAEQIAIKQAVVEIPSFEHSDKVLIQGQVSTGLNEAIQFLQQTPLRSKVDTVTDTLSISGTSQASLKLGIPFDADQDSQVEVVVGLDDAHLTVKPITMRIEHLQGNLIFTEHGVFSSGVDGRWMGQPIHATLKTEQRATQASINGSTTLNALQQQFSFLKNDFAHGGLSYQAALDLPFEPDEAGKLSIVSDLQGVTLTLPDNLAKTSEQKIPLRLELQFNNTPQLPIHIRYDKLLDAALVVDKPKQSLHAAHLVYGEGTALKPSESGIKLDIKQPVFRLSAWQAQWGKDSTASATRVSEINLNTEHLMVEDRDFGALNLAIKQQNQLWQGNLVSKIATGWLQIPVQLHDDSQIKLAMDFLNLSELEDLKLSGQDNFNAEKLPLVEITSQKLWWRSVNLGSLKLETERRVHGIHFKKLTLSSQKRKIALSADWLKLPNGTQTQITGTLEMDSFGQFLSDLKLNDDLKETHAHIEFEGDWLGAPHEFSLATINGKLKLHLTDGRIASIEPGVGRLLGLLAIEQWLKRLSLNFRDLYQQGLAFNDITGQFAIWQGLAKTEDLLIDAIPAKMRISGEIDLGRKTLNQRVAVIPKSSDALPIAGTIVGSVASVITQVLTGDSREGYFFGSEYQLTGSWQNVQVIPLHANDGLFNKTWRGLTGGVFSD